MERERTAMRRKAAQVRRSRRSLRRARASSASMNICGDVEAGLLGDLLEAGRAGDVDLGQAVADDVEADQQQAARRQRSGRCASAISRSRAVSGWATPLPPAARLPRISLPCGMRASAERHRLAADHQDALVALRRSRAGSAAPSPSCAPSWFSVSMIAAEVQAVGADAEDAHAAHAVERLQDDVAVLGVEALASPPRRASRASAR